MTQVKVNSALNTAAAGSRNSVGAKNNANDVDWDKVASSACEKLGKELDEKKVMYDELHRKKRKVEELIGDKKNTLKESKQKMDQNVKIIADKSSLIFAKEIAIEIIKSQIAKEKGTRSKI